MTIITVLLYKANQNTKDLKINNITISNGNSSPPNNSLKILHLSDLHLENISITPEELYEHISNQSVDLIALTGDFLDRKKSIPKLVPYLKVLEKISPQFGMYAVFGNHDYILKEENFLLLQNTLEENGFKTLRNEHITIQVNEQNINIIGIDDHHTKRSQVEKAYNGLPKGYNLVLTHDPNIVLKMEHVHFDYLLSGHFHGGQIHWPKPYHLYKMGKLIRMNMIKGLHFHRGKPFYISEGLGQTGVNLRVGSRPEITFHQIS